jgi:hypothetical protein
VFTINRNPSPADLRKFGWAMLGGFGGLGALLWVIHWWRVSGGGPFEWSGDGLQVTVLCLWALGLVLCVLSLLSPTLAKPVYVAWMTVTVPVGIVVSTVFLTLLFFIVLPLFSIVVRAGDPLRRRLTRGDTYWEDHKPYEPTLERMNRLF